MEKIENSQLVEAWQEKNKIHHFESSTKNLTKLVRVLGYEDIDEFLSDNPRAQEEIVEFISDWVSRSRDWQQAFREDLESSEDDLCPGCGFAPGDGINEDCNHDAGCGYWKKQ